MVSVVTMMISEMWDFSFWSMSVLGCNYVGVVSWMMNGKLIFGAMGKGVFILTYVTQYILRIVEVHGYKWTLSNGNFIFKAFLESDPSLPSTVLDPFVSGTRVCPRKFC